MTHLCSRFALVATLATAAACATDAPTASAPVDLNQPVFAKPTSAQNSYARYTIYSTMPDGSPTDVVGDGRVANGGSSSGGPAVYEAGVCGVEGQIFWYNQNPPGGDAVFDPNGGRNSCGALRTLILGAKGSASPFLNFRYIMQLADGESRDHRLIVINTGLSGCGRVQYEAGSEVRVTRLAGGVGASGAYGTGHWRAESVGSHLARCYQTVKGSTVPVGDPFLLRLHVVIEELRR